MELNVDWTTIKDFVNARSLSVQYFAYQGTYFIWAFDGPVELMARIPIVSPTPNPSDQYDFETNFQSNGNKSPTTSIIAAQAITTQFERTDIDLKLACCTADVQSDGTAEVSLKVPGVPGSSDGRLVGGGALFFNNSDVGDRVTKIAVVDVDNILGQGAETVLKTYTDEFVDEINQGWYIPVKRRQVEVESMGFYGMIPSGLYLEIYMKKGSGVTTGKAYLNIFWGRVE